MDLATGHAEGRATVEQTLELLKTPLEYLTRWRRDMEAHLLALDSARRLRPTAQLRSDIARLSGLFW